MSGNVTPPEFKPGDKVKVSWMGETVQATVDSEVDTTAARHIYRLLIPGHPGAPMYDENEMERVKP